MIRLLLILSLVATLLFGLLPIPAAVDRSTGHGEGAYAFAHGVPKAFFVSAFSAAHRPRVPVLIRHFLFDWALAFAVFATPVILLVCIRIAAFYAARAVNVLGFNDSGRNV